LIGSWTSGTPVLVGVLAVAISAYMAAVYLAADAARNGERELAEQFRHRALGAGGVAGIVAIVGLPVLHAGAHPLYHRLLDGPGLVGVAISVIGGLSTLVLVAIRRFEPARVSAAVAVAGMIIGWALAQQPLLLPHLTLRQAAAPHEALVVLLIAIAMGAAILFPSLAFLFSLVLRGHFDPGHVAQDAPASPRAVLAASSAGLFARLAVAGLLGGLGFLTAADAPWAHAIGVVCLLACAVFAFVAVDPTGLAAGGDASS
jgi:cytochrome d ubiquinol oxidase subunit II